MKRYLIFSLAFLTAHSQVCALEVAKDSFEHPLIIEVQSLHTQSEKGDKAATKLLITKLEGLTKSNPENHLYKAYLGSAYTLMSRDIGIGPSAFSNLKNGLKTMDAAVAAAPNKTSVRFIRAVNNFNLPAFINRRDDARRDFDILLKNVESKSEKLTPTTEQAIYYFAGLSYLQLNKKKEAKQALQKGADLKANAELDAKIALELTKLKKV